MGNHKSKYPKHLPKLYEMFYDFIATLEKSPNEVDKALIREEIKKLREWIDYMRQGKKILG